MIVQTNYKTLFCVLIIYWLALITSCGVAKSSARAMSSSPGFMLKTISSTTFSSGIIDNTTSAIVGTVNSLAIDPDDNYPAVAYFDTGEGHSYLMYAKWDGSDWDDKQVADGTYGVGGSPSLAFDSSGNPSIAYYDFANSALKWVYDYDDDGDWDEGDWPWTLADDENDGFGSHCSHAISGNKFGFAFTNDTDWDLLYIEYDVVTSTTSQVDVDTNNNVGQWCSLKFNSGSPKISYYDSTNGILKYAVRASGIWSVQSVNDNSGDDYGRYSSLDFNSNGVPSIAYYNDTRYSAMWARWSPGLNRWIFEAIVEGDEYTLTGYNMSHQWYGSSKCGFAFLVLDESSPYLEFVRWTPDGQGEYEADALYHQGGCSFAWITSGPNAGDGWTSHGDNNGTTCSLRYTYVND